MLCVMLGRVRLGYVLVIVLNDKHLSYQHLLNSFGLKIISKSLPSSKEMAYCKEDQSKNEIDKAKG